MRGLRARTSFLLSAVVLVAVALAPSPAAAHNLSTASPNGVSPWLYSQSWRMAGSWYGEGLHVDMYGTSHYNDYYALDFSLPNAPCNQRLYPIWDGMKVDTVDRSIGRLTMTKSINGITYRTKYMHMSSINYNPGAIVNTTTIVGYTGNLGQSSGCHLHISTHRWYNGTWYSIPPKFCGRTYPHDHSTYFKGC